MEKLKKNKKLKPLSFKIQKLVFAVRRVVNKHKPRLTPPHTHTEGVRTSVWDSRFSERRIWIQKFWVGTWPLYDPERITASPWLSAPSSVV